jgi:hypothetical protein
MKDIIKLIADGEYTTAQVAEGLFEVTAHGGLDYELDEAAKSQETFGDAAKRFQRHADLAMSHFGEHAQAQATGQPTPIKKNLQYWNHVANMHRIANKHPSMLNKFVKHPVMQAHEHVLATSGKTPNEATGSLISRKDHPVGALGKQAVANATDMSQMRPIEHYNKWTEKMHGAFRPIPVTGDSNGKYSNPNSAGFGNSGDRASSGSTSFSGNGVNGPHPVSPEATALAKTDPYHGHEQLDPMTKSGHRLSEISAEPGHPYSNFASQLIAARDHVLKHGDLAKTEIEKAEVWDTTFGANGPHRAVLNAAKAEFDKNNPGGQKTVSLSDLSVDPTIVAQMAAKKAARAQSIAASATPAETAKDRLAGHQTLDPVTANGQRVSDVLASHPNGMVRSSIRSLIDKRDRILGGTEKLDPSSSTTFDQILDRHIGKGIASGILKTAAEEGPKMSAKADLRRQAAARLAPKDAGRGLPSVQLANKPLTPAAAAIKDVYTGHKTLDPIATNGKRMSELMKSHPSKLVRESLRDLAAARTAATEGKKPSKADVEHFEAALEKHMGNGAVQTLFANAAKEHTRKQLIRGASTRMLSPVDRASKLASLPKVPSYVTTTPAQQMAKSQGAVARALNAPTLSGKGAPSTFGHAGKLGYASPLQRARVLLGHKLRKWLHKAFPKSA